MSQPSPLRFAFLGTPDVANKTLEILKQAGYLPSLIITGPDRPVGRHFTMTPPPVKTWAIENNIPYLQPDKITEEVITELKKESWDLFVVVAYGKILPQALIDIPTFGTLNIHYSLLPKWRGASPVEAAILHGDTETGVCVQRMVFKLDAGNILAQESLPIGINETHEDVRNKLIPIGAKLLIHTLSNIFLPLTKGETTWATAHAEGVVQDETQMSKCGKIKKEDALVQPFTDNPADLWNKYRAYFGWPGLYFFDESGKRIKITKACYEEGKFIIERVIREGKGESNW